MYIEYKGTVPKRCLHCGGLMIENTKHECITSGEFTISQKENMTEKRRILNDLELTNNQIEHKEDELYLLKNRKARMESQLAKLV